MKTRKLLATKSNCSPGPTALPPCSLESLSQFHPKEQGGKSILHSATSSKAVTFQGRLGERQSTRWLQEDPGTLRSTRCSSNRSEPTDYETVYLKKKKKAFPSAKAVWTQLHTRLVKNLNKLKGTVFQILHNQRWKKWVLWALTMCQALWSHVTFTMRWEL